MSGWRGLRGVWPAVLVCGGTFAVVQFAWSNFVGVELVDIAGGLASIAALALFCARVAAARRVGVSARRGRLRPHVGDACSAARDRARLRPTGAAPGAVVRAWMPWLFLSVAVILWGLAPVKAFLNGGPRGPRGVSRGRAPDVSRVLSPTWNVPLLHRAVFRDYPVVPAPVDRARISDPAYRNDARRGGGVHVQLGVGDRHGDPARRAGDRALPARAAVAVPLASPA